LDRVIAEVLIPALRKRFPTAGMRTGGPPDAVAVFPAKHPAVGEVRIWDDGDEATISVGDITHWHTYPSDPSIDPRDAALSATEEIVGFLEELFADRILLWRAPGCGAGGWFHRAMESAALGLGGDELTYVWSGPVPNPRA
jgi:hypothetical protein